MQRSWIYLTQFGTGGSVNLLPLAAGQLSACIKQDFGLLEQHPLGEIVHQRDDPDKVIAKLKPVFAMGFSVYAWNLKISYAMAKEVKQQYPDSLIVFGGPAITKERDHIHQRGRVRRSCDTALSLPRWNLRRALPQVSR